MASKNSEKRGLIIQMIWLLIIVIIMIKVANCSEICARSSFEALNKLNLTGERKFHIEDDLRLYPFTVSIVRNKRKLVCQGSIIKEKENPEANSSRLVLTAAHCFKSKDRTKWDKIGRYAVFTAVDSNSMLSRNSVRKKIDDVKVMLFSEEHQENVANGIAIITLRTPINFDNNVTSVCLASADRLRERIDDLCYTLTFKEGRIAWIRVRLLNEGECYMMLPRFLKGIGLCLVKHDQHTLSYLGAPLVCHHKLTAYMFGIYLSDLSINSRNGAHQIMCFASVLSIEGKEEHGIVKEVKLLPEGGNKSLSEEEARQERVPSTCGDVKVLGENISDYLNGKESGTPFPWDVLILSPVLETVECLGSLVHLDQLKAPVNASNLVITASDCIKRKENSLQWSDFEEVIISGAKPTYSVYNVNNGQKRKVDFGLSHTVIRYFESANYGVVVLKLRKPITYEQGAVAACLPESSELPPPSSECYVTRFALLPYKVVRRRVEILGVGCNDPFHTDNDRYAGICARESKPLFTKTDGSPLICVQNGIAVLYGIQLTRGRSGDGSSIGFYFKTSIAKNILISAPAHVRGNKTEYVGNVFGIVLEHNE